MAKDNKGHGSDRRGVEARLAAARNDPNHPLGVLTRIVSQGTPIAGQDAAAADNLAGGHPKSGVVPVHGGASGRSDREFKHVGHGEKFNFTGERDHPFSGIAKGPWQKTGARSYTHAESGGKYRVGTTKAKTY